MHIKPIKTRADHRAALKEIEALMTAKRNSPQGERLDVALEALKDARKKKKVSADDLWRCAKICRVANVMRPYLESVE